MLHDRLRKLRNDRQISQKCVAEVLGVTTQTIQSWERGTSEPKVSHLVTISRLYGVSIDEICTGHETSQNQRLALKISEAEKLNQDEKNCIEMLLEAMLVRHYAKSIKIAE